MVEQKTAQEDELAQLYVFGEGSTILAEGVFAPGRIPVGQALVAVSGVRRDRYGQETPGWRVHGQEATITHDDGAATRLERHKFFTSPDRPTPFVVSRALLNAQQAFPKPPHWTRN